jgi:hypothetical protein
MSDCSGRHLKVSRADQCTVGLALPLMVPAEVEKLGKAARTVAGAVGCHPDYSCLPARPPRQGGL